MVLNATFNNISVRFIGGGNRSTRQQPPTCHKSLTHYQIMLYRVHLAVNKIEITVLVMIGTEYACSCKSNLYTITTMTVPEI